MTEDNIAQGASEGQVRVSPGRVVIKRSAPYDTAKKFVTQARSPLIHYREMFYEWTGTHYLEVEDGAIRERIYEFLDNGFVRITEKDSEGTLLTAERPFRPTSRDVNQVIDALKARVRVSSDLQAPVWGPEASPEQRKHKAADILPCSNGLLDLTTTELLPHSDDFFSMNAVDYTFDAEAQAPLWEKFLEEILPGDIEAQQTIEEMLGYLLTADTTQQKAFALIGKRRSGKGTISRVLDGLLGGAANVAHPTMASLKTQFGLASLIDKKVATIGDARLDGSTNELVERMLTISGEDAISIPRKYREDWEGTLPVRFLLLSNEAPGFTDASATIVSRFILIRFRQSFEANPDTALTSKLLKERSGILNRAIAGLKRLRERGHFQQPKSAADMIEMMEHIASPITRFLGDKCETGPDYEEALKVLYEIYQTWCENNGHKVKSTSRFQQALVAAAPEVGVRKLGPRGKQRYMCLGVRLATRGARIAGNVVELHPAASV